MRYLFVYSMIKNYAHPSKFKGVHFINTVEVIKFTIYWYINEIVL